MSEDHARIWLEPRSPDDRYGHEGRLWCQDNVWGGEDGEPTEYVRADLIRPNGMPRFNEAMRRAEAAEARALAAEQRAERAEAALRCVVEWLERPKWGKWSYMERSEIYSDKNAYLAFCRAALTPQEGEDE